MSIVDEMVAKLQELEQRIQATESRISPLRFEGAGAPGVGDDEADGYSVGSLWYDTTADQMYVCLDQTGGAAVWVKLASTTYVNGRWVWLTTPATSTSWDGDAKTGASGTIDLSAVFSIPAGVKAIVVIIEAGDESVNVEFGLGPSVTYYDPVSQRTNVANFHIKCAGVVPCDANGDVYFYQGSELDFVLIRIYGYAI